MSILKPALLCRLLILAGSLFAFCNEMLAAESPLLPPLVLHDFERAASPIPGEI